VRKVLLQMGLSVDGIVAGGPQGASQAGAPDEDEAVRRWKVESLHQVGAHIMGRVTYEQMAAPLLKDLLAPLPSGSSTQRHSRTARPSRYMRRSGIA